jgi:hypothetical protein
MSKKFPPAHLTITLAVVEGVFGTVIACVPSLGVFARTTVYVNPPSVEIKISTLAQLTGALVVLATFHVTFCVVAPVQVIPVALGTVTEKGPEVFVTDTVELANSVHPPPVALSRTVTLKFIVLVTVGNTSQVYGPFAASEVRFGKYLVVFVVGLKDLKFAPAVAVAEGEVVAVPVFVCSQQYVKVLVAFGSVPVAVRKNGVP